MNSTNSHPNRLLDLLGCPLEDALLKAILLLVGEMEAQPRNPQTKRGSSCLGIGGSFWTPNWLTWGDVPAPVHEKGDQIERHHVRVANTTSSMRSKHLLGQNQITPGAHLLGSRHGLPLHKTVESKVGSANVRVHGICSNHQRAEVLLFS